MEDVRELVKTAIKIQETLSELRNARWLALLNYLASLARYLKDLSLQAKKLGTSLTHSWFAAAQQCSIRISRSLDDLTYSLPGAKQFLSHRQKEVPKLSLLVAELEQLRQEFGNIDYDSEHNCISVITEPIDLEGLYLGPFRIQLRLDWLKDLYQDSPYCCIALDPHPAATCEDVTHPHVSNEKLCEGEGAAAIRAALEEGRLCDFFTMVRSILNTYSPDSPYVALHDWDGEPCYDCGYVMNSENSYYCGFCDHGYCEECSSYCRLCDETVCLGCGGQCPHCEEMVCPNCISRCTECNGLCCKECLEEDLCPNCKQEMEIENEEHTNETTRTTGNGEQEQPETTSPEIKLAG
ncbi:MAG: hypothetical protein ACYSSO_12540 [Planctomycetota bacterium]